MTDRSKTGADGDGAPAAGDFGRRVAARREYLGLSRGDVALRTASAPGYIEYVETQPGSHGMGFVVRLAHALESTVPLGRAARQATPGWSRSARTSAGHSSAAEGSGGSS